jgi:acetyl-CoA carboxylase, biotin carboxylase subunit
VFSKILIANRGEIALRIIRAAKELGIQTVAVYSDADKESVPVLLADEAVRLGLPKSSESYLNIPKLMEAAQQTGAEAIHPGYGFLAENTQFAQACAQAKLKFVGPTVENLRLAGDKLDAKESMRAAGLPVIPGSHRGLENLGEIVTLAKEVGYPVMIKAAAGGGGRGMRICLDETLLREEFPVAQAEAKAAFGDGKMYLEKFIPRARHVEVQVLGDGQGHAVHFGERNCSVQRRHQKLIEESPCPGIDQPLRERIWAAALQGVTHIRYTNAGTMEFLLDEADHFYFMEINARIQVEHPVSEMVMGVDLIKEQLKIAAGEPLKISQEKIERKGWAIECRINAEDPDLNFLPSPGKIDRLFLPGGFGVRVDTHIHAGYEIPIYYDTLIAKLIAYGENREAAIGVMSRCLDEFTISPISTTIPLHRKLLKDPEFIQGRYFTDIMNRYLPEDEEEEE